MANYQIKDLLRFMEWVSKMEEGNALYRNRSSNHRFYKYPDHRWIIRERDYKGPVIHRSPDGTVDLTHFELINYFFNCVVGTELETKLPHYSLNIVHKIV